MADVCLKLVEKKLGTKLSRIVSNIDAIALKLSQSPKEGTSFVLWAKDLLNDENRLPKKKLITCTQKLPVHPLQQPIQP